MPLGNTYFSDTHRLPFETSSTFLVCWRPFHRFCPTSSSPSHVVFSRALLIAVSFSIFTLRVLVDRGWTRVCVGQSRQDKIAHPITFICNFTHTRIHDVRSIVHWNTSFYSVYCTDSNERMIDCDVYAWVCVIMHDHVSWDQLHDSNGDVWLIERSCTEPYTHLSYMRGGAHVLMKTWDKHVFASVHLTHVMLSARTITTCNSASSQVRIIHFCHILHSWIDMYVCMHESNVSNCMVYSWLIEDQRSFDNCPSLFCLRVECHLLYSCFADSLIDSTCLAGQARLLLADADAHVRQHHPHPHPLHLQLVVVHLTSITLNFRRNYLRGQWRCISNSSHLSHHRHRDQALLMCW